MARSCLTIILAAGEGSRMHSSDPKVLHKVAGLSLLGHVMQASHQAGGERQIVVVGRAAEKVAAHARKLDENVKLAEQSQRLGTAHAVLAARDEIAKGYDDVLILMGDAPLVSPKSLGAIRSELSQGVAVVVLGFVTDDPEGYGRLIEQGGQLLAIKEHKEASQEELQITFCNGGIWGLSGTQALSLLDAIDNNNNKGEYYLTDCVKIARKRGLQVVAIEADERELHGVNDRSDLARIESIWQDAKRQQVMESGVTLQSPDRVHFSHDTKIGADTVIEPDVYFGPGVTIGERVEIKAFSHIEGADIEAGAIIGPFARLRHGTQLGEKAKVGNFCETKNAKIASGAKINHLSYIGDAIVGGAANIGAGTITCNYDGANKHLTQIGEGAFIGSNSSLVAPIAIGKGAYIGSGSIVTRDVPDEALAISRSRQENKDGYGRRIRERNAKIKVEKQSGK